MKLITTIFITTIIVTTFWVWLIDRNLQNIGSFYDYYWNSASGWICVAYEPPEAHPEMYFDFKTFEVRTKIVCHGERMDFTKFNLNDI